MAHGVGGCGGRVVACTATAMPSCDDSQATVQADLDGRCKGLKVPQALLPPGTVPAVVRVECKLANNGSAGDTARACTQDGLFPITGCTYDCGGSDNHASGGGPEWAEVEGNCSTPAAVCTFPGSPLLAWRCNAIATTSSVTGTANCRAYLAASSIVSCATV